MKYVQHYLTVQSSTGLAQRLINDPGLTELVCERHISPDSVLVVATLLNIECPMLMYDIDI